MEKQKTLILIDGHALAFRQYFALERTNMKNSEGMPTWAVFGFFKAIFDLLKNKTLQPDAICVAFDVSHQTFRVEKYAEYKANREAMPDNMRCQMDLIYEGLDAFNIPIYTKEGFEADDVIGTISKQACELGHKVLILTGDQDSFQLIDKDGCVKVIIPSKGLLTEYDWDKVHEKLGVYPDQVVDYKSLRGDSSDNIPGVKGIGEKTAVKLLAEYGHLQNIIDDCPNMKEGNVKRCLCNDLEMAKMSYFLATIIRDVDIDFDFDGTKIEVPDVAKVTAFLKKLQFYTFLKNIDTILSSFDKDAKEQPIVPVVGTDIVMLQAGQSQGQLGLFSEAVKAEINKEGFAYETKLITDSADLEELVKTLKTKSLITFRTENDVKSAVQARLYGLAIAYNDDITADNRIEFVDNKNVTKSFYIPIGHYIENQLKLDDVLSALKPIFEDENIKKTTYDAKLEYNVLKTCGIETKGIIFDVFLASYVKDPSRVHNLEIQALENVEHVVNDAVPLIKDTKTTMSVINISIDNALDYVSDVVTTILELTKFWVGKLDEKELKLVYEVEVPLTIVLAKMEYTGVAIDAKYLNDLSRHMANLLRSIEFKIYKIAGEAFNISSPKQVAEVLFDKLQLKPAKKRTKTKYSTSADVLEELAVDNEIARLILQYRKYAKLKSTYTDAIPELRSPVDGRIHCKYNQAMTVTGRLSSSNPNMQNIPVRTEEGNKIRKAFIPQNKETSMILSADYSQIELRLLAHVSGDKNLIQAFKSGEDVHTITASKVFDVPLHEVTKKMRYKAKAVNFGIVYGQSKYGLAKALGITNAEAETFINKYFETYPDVKHYMENMVTLVSEKGYVETLLGRKRYLAAEFNSTNSIMKEFAKRAAINQPMQGSAADLIKLAMVDLDKKMTELNLKSKVIIQVHDELVIEAEKDEIEILKKVVLEAMELNQPLLVPLVVDFNVGETWQEL